MTATRTIARVGMLLWGRRWAQDMARELRRDRSTIYAWRDGVFRPPVEVWQQLRLLLRAQRDESRALLKILDGRS